jgi:hypothetical protein
LSGSLIRTSREAIFSSWPAANARLETVSRSLRWWAGKTLGSRLFERERERERERWRGEGGEREEEEESVRTREGEQYTRAPAVVLAGRLFPPPAVAPPSSLSSLLSPLSLLPLSLSLHLFSLFSNENTHGFAL